MKKGLLLLFSLFLTIGVAPVVFATPLLSLDGGTYGSIPGTSAPTNDLLQGIYGSDSKDGYYGSQVMLTGSGSLTFEYLGSEAGFTNSFFYRSDLLFANRGTQLSTVRDKYSFSFDTGDELSLLQFFFTIANTDSVVVNGANIDGSNDGFGNTANFFVAWDDNAIGTSMVLFLDDNPYNDDDNHDDMAVRISVAPVPEPATMMLFGIGLLGIAGVSRKIR